MASKVGFEPTISSSQNWWVWPSARHLDMYEVLILFSTEVPHLYTLAYLGATQPLATHSSADLLTSTVTVWRSTAELMGQLLIKYW